MQLEKLMKAPNAKPSGKTTQSQEQYTAGPWAVLDATPTEVRLSYGFMENNLVLAHVFDGPEFGSMEANARRIVACINACEGISTEALEHEPGSLGLDRDTIRAQRDALAAQNTELVEALSGLTQVGSIDGNVVVGPRGWELVQALLAKVRP